MPPITVEQFEQLINQFASSTGIGLIMAAPLTLLLVALLKRVPVLVTVKSEWLAFATATVFWGILQVGGASETAIPFGLWYDKLNAVIPLIIGVIATLGGSSFAYRLSESWDWPVVGYKRDDVADPATPPAVG